MVSQLVRMRGTCTYSLQLFSEGVGPLANHYNFYMNRAQGVNIGSLTERSWRGLVGLGGVGLQLLLRASLPFL